MPSLFTTQAHIILKPTVDHLITFIEVLIAVIFHVYVLHQLLCSGSLQHHINLHTQLTRRRPAVTLTFDL